MHRWLPVIACLVLLPSFALAQTRTAEWGFETGSNGYGSFGFASLVTARSQEFLATVSGDVRAMGIRIGRSSDHSVDLRVSLYAAEDGKPTGPPLMTWVYDPASIPVAGSGEAVIFLFPEDRATVQAGNRYAIVAEPVEFDDTTPLYFLNGGSQENATYEDGVSSFRVGTGSIWTVGETTDWGFRVILDDSTPVEARTWGKVKSSFQ